PYPRDLEIRISRERFDLGASYLRVSPEVTNHRIQKLNLGVSGIEVRDLALEVAKVSVIRRDGTKRGVPHDFCRHFRIVGVEERERLAGDITLNRSMIRGKADLCGIFLGRILVGWRPFDSSGCYDVHSHAARNRIVGAGTHQRLDRGGVRLRDSVTRFD